MKLRAGLITGAIAVLALLSACGTHPGAAAVVDGKTISVDAVDDSATAYCNLSLAQGAQPLSTADARRQALAGLIAWNVAMNLADENNLNLDSAEWALSDEERQQLEQTFDAADLPVIEKVLKRSHHTAAIQTALGEQRAGDSGDADEAGREAIVKELDGSDLSIDPRFGVDDSLNQVASSGSLSVPSAGEDESAQKLAEGQQCS